VLVTTIAARDGGVSAMLRFVLDALIEQGFQPVVAFYKPYSEAAHLSVPLFRIGRGRVRSQRETWLGRYDAHAIGCWLPELEFTHYLPTRHWRELMDACEFHISVSGNCLAATGSTLRGRPNLAWVATPWHGDRKDRVAHFPLIRRILDRLLNRHFLLSLERKILRRCAVLALSEYTRKELDALAGKVLDVMPMPVDTQTFAPDPDAVVIGRVGFSGRFNDPRKNMPLLLAAVRIARRDGLDLHLELIGDQSSPELLEMVRVAGLEGCVQIMPHLDRAILAEHLRGLDVFVVPSHQEGLCIAALEAMASGCPVVSTRCGGPEEFVRDAYSGYCVDFDAEAMAQALGRIVRDRRLRKHLAEGARATVVARYQVDVARAIFWRAFNVTFGTIIIYQQSGEN